ncbi:MAG: hypothetical protein WCT20_02760 [Candidatus Babeliales bacterium]
MLKLSFKTRRLAYSFFVVATLTTSLLPTKQDNQKIEFSFSFDKNVPSEKRKAFCYSCGFLTAATLLTLNEKAPTGGLDLFCKSLYIVFCSVFSGIILSSVYDNLYTVGESIFSNKNGNQKKIMTPQIKDFLKHIKLNQTHIKNNSATCQVNEYPFNEPTLGIARSTINGRYPTNAGKKVINTECDLIYYVLDGSGKVETGGETFTLEKDDALFLACNKSYWVEGKGLDVLVISAPEWTIKQYEEV